MAADERHLSTGGTTEIGVGVGDVDAELLY